ncbi:YqzL family protein [Brevibacillus fluminis]|uniref:YqzL family protein n=1 Tax=Brevibacillus fluminis TaxID=511487 RepID=A0A3M8D2I2_9BACL|nr:YqzL family protein [Brevibacillus fluminis]RNB82280.1 YqzL family protein [Brevibacillus fluminis]
MLRDFSWSYFASTGDIHAYLLYREHDQQPIPVIQEEPDSIQGELGES